MYRRRRSRARPLLGLVLVVIVAAAAAWWLGLLPAAPVASLPTLQQATPVPTPVPPQALALEAGQKFLHSWQAADYEGMYSLVSSDVVTDTTKDRFTSRYRGITEGILQTDLKVELGTLTWAGAPDHPLETEATLPFTATIKTARFGDIIEENWLPLVNDQGTWRVKWSPSLIFKGLSNDNTVRVTTDDPVRGSIVDRNGRVLAGPGKVLSIGVVPGQIKDENRVLTALSSYLGADKDAIKGRYANAQPDWWVPLGDYPLDMMNDAKAKLGGIEGIGLREKASRVYPEKALASQVLGYVTAVTAEDLEKMPDRGLEDGDWVGRTGIEAWADEVLAGVKGGKVVIVDKDGEVERTIADRPAVPGGQVKLTLDVDLQRQAEQILGDKAGSIVAIDPRDNTVLAMASHPTFDPNGFVIGMSTAEWKKLSEDTRAPFQNRPVLSAYAPGSIFKVITMAAALEQGGFAPGSPFNCLGSWTAPGGLKMNCWVLSGHGDLNLSQGLTSSCDVVFYEVSQALNAKDPTLLASFARQFGLGKPTGINGVAEAEGTVPDPAWKQSNVKQDWYPGDAANMAIGQGYLEVTPLQMANVYSSLASGGALRKPILVASVDDGRGGERFTTEEVGKVPASEATLKTIRDALERVTAHPSGTAYYAFNGFDIPTAGKTGSAENQNPEANAWFAGFAPAEQPEIVVIAMVEGGEHGSEVAAPLGRKMFEAYFANSQ